MDEQRDSQGTEDFFKKLPVPGMEYLTLLIQTVVIAFGLPIVSIW